MKTKEKAQIRGVGLAFALAGDGLMYWAWHDVRANGSFSYKMAVLGPCLVALGAHLLIEAPPLPVNRPSPLGWVLLIAGVVAGFAFAEFLRAGHLPLMG